MVRLYIRPLLDVRKNAGFHRELWFLYTTADPKLQMNAAVLEI